MGTQHAAAAKLLQLCPTLCDPIDGSPPGFPRPWDSPGKNTGVGCHFLLQCMKAKSEREVAQACPTLVTPWTAACQAPPSMGFSRQEYWSGMPLPSPVHSIFKYKRKIYLLGSVSIWLDCCLCCSVTKSCPTLCDPMNCSTPGFPGLHYIPELAQSHAH